MLSNKEKNGFTLIEVLVTLFVLSVALVGVFFIITQNLANATRVGNNILGAHLAQEGVELVRNIRDNEWHATDTFGNTLPNGTHEVQALTWNSLNSRWDPAYALRSFNDQFLKKDPATGVFGYDLGADSIFKRKVVISTPTGEGAFHKIVTVTVSWAERASAKSIIVEEHLYDWLP